MKLSETIRKWVSDGLDIVESDGFEQVDLDLLLTDLYSLRYADAVELSVSVVRLVASTLEHVGVMLVLPMSSSTQLDTEAIDFADLLGRQITEFLVPGLYLTGANYWNHFDAVEQYSSPISGPAALSLTEAGAVVYYRTSRVDPKEYQRSVYLRWG